STKRTASGKRSPRLTSRALVLHFPQRSIVVVATSPAAIGACNFPDRPRAGNLHERHISRVSELRVRIGESEVAHRAIVNQVCGVIRSEANGRRRDDAMYLHNEGLFGFAGAAWRAIRVPALIRLPAVECEAQ